MRFLFIVLFPCFVHAQIPEYPEPFLIDQWGRGLHIFFGGGVQTSTYRSNHQNSNLGWGINLRSEVDWNFNPDWAIEFSTIVNFDQYNSDLLWNTILALGFRHRLNKSYLRLMAGSGVLVIIPDDGKKSQASRIQLDGPAIGAGFGKFETTQKGDIWYWEFTGTIQSIKQREEIVMDGEIPVSIASRPVNDNSKIYSLQVSVGVLLF
jgi:hypothetical protein